MDDDCSVPFHLFSVSDASHWAILFHVETSEDQSVFIVVNWSILEGFSERVIVPVKCTTSKVMDYGISLMRTAELDSEESPDSKVLLLDNVASYLTLVSLGLRSELVFNEKPSAICPLHEWLSVADVCEARWKGPARARILSRLVDVFQFNESFDPELVHGLTRQPSLPDNYLTDWPLADDEPLWIQQRWSDAEQSTLPVSGSPIPPHPTPPHYYEVPDTPWMYIPGRSGAYYTPLVSHNLKLHECVEWRLRNVVNELRAIFSAREFALLRDSLRQHYMHVHADSPLIRPVKPQKSLMSRVTRALRQTVKRK